MKKKFYDKYKWEKCSLNCFYNRVWKWMTYEEAIKPKKFSITKTSDRKTCYKCKETKLISLFNQNICKECVKVKHKKYYEENKEDIFKKRKEQRETEIWLLKRKLDTIFYADPNIQKIIKIEWPFRRKKRILQGEVKKDKFFYFL